MNRNFYRKVIGKEELRNFEAIKFQGTIHYIKTLEEAEEAIKQLKNCELLGFDTEAVPYKIKDPQKKLALIQLCNEQECYLFAVRKTGIPQGLIDLFSDSNILKIGVAVNGDIKEMKKIVEFEEAGFIDLQHIVRDYGIEVLSLSKISAVVLGRRVSKREQRSNWGRTNLTDAQKLYAATDAWTALMIYKKLTGK